MAAVEPIVFTDAMACAVWLRSAQAGKKLVTTNGCFDILHRGHVACLVAARALGEVLVVGINSDESVRRLKGPTRPANREGDRAYVIAGLAAVDAAFVFGEDDPRAFLEILRPAIHAKGGDYTRDIIERETVERHGGRLETVSFVGGYSTTGTIDRLTK